MLHSQTLNHADKITVLGIKLPDAFGIALVPPNANLMAPGDLVLVMLKVFCDLFRRVLIEKSDGAFRYRAIY